MVQKDACIAYRGSEFTIEWYFNEQNRSQAFEYYSTLTDTERRRVLMLFKRMGDFGKISDTTKFRNEGDKIYAFKPQPHRFLSFFIKGRTIILINAFQKKSYKLPLNEKKRAMDFRMDYLSRTERGTYYGE